MRARRLLPVTILGVLLLSGCVPQPVTHPSESLPSATPVFASEEEALAAAVAAYEVYLTVSDEIAADGGAHPDRLKDLVTEEWYEVELEGFSAIAKAGIFQEGATLSRNALLEAYSDGADGEVQISVCTDTSGTAFRDGVGKDVTSETRKTHVTVEVTFRLHAELLLLERNEPWATDSLC